MVRKIHRPHTAAAKLAFDKVFAVQRLACEVEKIHTLFKQTLTVLPRDLQVITTPIPIKFSIFA